MDLLARARRNAIIAYLDELQPATVDELATALGMETGEARQGLRVLQGDGLVRAVNPSGKRLRRSHNNGKMLTVYELTI